RRRLAPDPFHHAPIAAQREDAVIEKWEIRFVEVARQPFGRDRHADAGRDPLTERSRRRLDPRGQMVFGMTRTLAVELAKSLQIVEWDAGLLQPLVVFVDRVDAGQMQHRIKQGRGMAGGQHKAIAVWPDWVLRIEAEKILPQGVYDRRHCHRRTRMSRFCLL